MKKCVKAVMKTVKWMFIVFCIYLGSLFFRQERIPMVLCDYAISKCTPTNLVVHCDKVTVGFRHGLSIVGLKVYDLGMKDSLKPIIEADSISINYIMRRITAVGLTYPRLPDSYYEPGNQEKNARVEAEFPSISPFEITLLRPNILSVKPLRVTSQVHIAPHRIDFKQMHLDWPDAERKLAVDGLCYVDLDSQEVYGEVDGHATQPYIRPMLVALDVPVAFPYFDGFTGVTEPVPAFCSWHVNLVNNDFDLVLRLKPELGEYNGVPMQRAEGEIKLHNFIRGTNLNYRQTIGPIHGVGHAGKLLDGTVIVEGIDGYNKVDVDAESSLAVADILKIGGFVGDYVGNDVWGDSKCKLQFRFPRAMTNNYEVLNGHGHVEIKDGQLMRMKGFKGMLEAMPSIAPAVSWFSDATQASCDYRIENGVLKTDNIYIDSMLYSLKMYGEFDATKEKLDFTVRLQFAKSDSFVGKIIQPITWPFTKLILEFKLTGSPDDPKWKYVSIIDRVMGVVQ